MPNENYLALDAVEFYQIHCAIEPLSQRASLLSYWGLYPRLPWIFSAKLFQANMFTLSIMWDWGFDSLFSTQFIQIRFQPILLLESVAVDSYFL